MDDLKKWLENNRNAKDYYQADLDELWVGIDRGLQKKAPRGYGMWVRWAAAILLAVTATWMLYPSDHSSSEGYALREISPELADTEFYYAQMLGEKMEIIKASGADIDPRMYEDLDQLDQIYKDLMMDLRDNADNEEVVEAMIENYRIRLQILEQMLNQIQKTENDDRDDASI